MTDVPELKPCPFCGSNEIDPRSGGSPECSICGASACNSDWNTRADLSAARIAELEAERDACMDQIEQALDQRDDAAAVAHRAEARAEASEAKLAVAEEAIIWLEAEIKENGFPEEGFMRRKCRATIEQLKGTDQ